jgi:hypothetical protein
MAVVGRKPAQAAALGIAMLAFVAAAQAQTGPLSLEETRQCLCRSQQLDRWRRENDMHLAMYEERKAELMSMIKTIDQQRALVDPNDLAAVEAFRRMMTREHALRNYVQEELLGAYRDRLKQYGELVGQYNAMCTKRAMPKPHVEALKGNLQCPEFP